MTDAVPDGHAGRHRPGRRHRRLPPVEAADRAPRRHAHDARRRAVDRRPRRHRARRHHAGRRPARPATRRRPTWWRRSAIARASSTGSGSTSPAPIRALALREQAALADDDVAVLDQAARAASTPGPSGPWTRRVLRADRRAARRARRRPRRRASGWSAWRSRPTCASSRRWGSPRASEVGYRLSPRGHAWLRPVRLPVGDHGGDGAAVARHLGVPSRRRSSTCRMSVNPVAPDVAAARGRPRRGDRTATRSRRRRRTRWPRRSACRAGSRRADERRRRGDRPGGRRARCRRGRRPRVLAVPAAPRRDPPRRRALAVEPVEPAGPARRPPTTSRRCGTRRSGRWRPARGRAATTTAWRLGSLTKLWACPGLRLGYVIAPDAERRGARRRPPAAVGGERPRPRRRRAAAGGDRPARVGDGGAPPSARDLAAALVAHGHDVAVTAANWLLVRSTRPLRDRAGGARRGRPRLHQLRPRRHVPRRPAPARSAGTRWSPRSPPWRRDARRRRRRPARRPLARRATDGGAPGRLVRAGDGRRRAPDLARPTEPPGSCTRRSGSAAAWLVGVGLRRAIGPHWRHCARDGRRSRRSDARHRGAGGRRPARRRRPRRAPGDESSALVGRDPSDARCRRRGACRRRVGRREHDRRGGRPGGVGGGRWRAGRARPPRRQHARRDGRPPLAALRALRVVGRPPRRRRQRRPRRRRRGCSSPRAHPSRWRAVGRAVVADAGAPPVAERRRDRSGVRRRPRRRRSVAPTATPTRSRIAVGSAPACRRYPRTSPGPCSCAGGSAWPWPAGSIADRRHRSARRRPRRRSQRPAGVEQPVDGVGEALGGGDVAHLATVALGHDEPGVGEHAQVLDDRLAGRREVVGERRWPSAGRRGRGARGRRGGSGRRGRRTARRAVDGRRPGSFTRTRRAPGPRAASCARPRRLADGTLADSDDLGDAQLAPADRRQDDELDGRHQVGPGLAATT